MAGVSADLLPVAESEGDANSRANMETIAEVAIGIFHMQNELASPRRTIGNWTQLHDSEPLTPGDPVRPTHYFKHGPFASSFEGVHIHYVEFPYRYTVVVALASIR